MMRMVTGLVVLAALCLAGCDSKAPDNGAVNAGESVTIVDNAAGNGVNALMNAAGAKTGGAEDEAAVRAVIDTIYASYRTPTGPTDAATPLSPDFRAAMDRANRENETGLGYDPWCDCQDFDASRFDYSIKGVDFTDDGDHARVRLSLNLGIEGSATRPVNKWVMLVRTPKGWLVDDLGNALQKSLKAEIRSAPAIPAAAPAPASNAA